MFLIRGLGLSEGVINKQLTYDAEKWSGEKMILIPALIDRSLSRSVIVESYAQHNAKGNVGVVALVPSFRNTADWQRYGAVIAKRENIDQFVQALIDGERDNTAVFANRYDGIDLPDDACRIVVFDSLPLAEELFDRYVDGCRGDSIVTKTRRARIIEQVLGRSVRGEKDYCAIIVTGAELVSMIRSADTGRYCSAQTRAQIDIGLDIASYAREDAEKSAEDTNGLDVLGDLVAQCLKRDAGWKEFYVSR